METGELASIYNARLLSDRLLTSGQPTAEQLAAVARAGYEIVINLALGQGPNALEGEDDVAEGLGLIYHHIPVAWNEPQLLDLERFFDLMTRYQGRPVFVHCMANMRVSAFVMLYRVLKLGWPRHEALPDMLAIWTPNATWQAFIDAALEKG